MPRESETSLKKFAVVGFVEDNSADVIPSSWVVNRSKSKWPKVPDANIPKYIEQCKPLDENYRFVEIKLYGHSNSFRKAKKMARQALDTSHIDSDSSGELGKRRRKKPLRYLDSDDDISEAESVSLLKELPNSLAKESYKKRFNFPDVPRVEEIGSLGLNLNNYVLEPQSNMRNMPSTSSLNLSSSLPVDVRPGIINHNQVNSRNVDFTSSLNFSDSLPVAVPLDVQQTSDRKTIAFMQKILECFEQVKSKLEQMDKKIDMLTTQVDSISMSTASVTDTVVSVDFKCPDIKLPLETEQQLNELNESFKKDRNMAGNWVRYLHRIGNGKSASAFMLSLCKKIMSPELASMYSRFGRKGKKSFSGLYRETLSVLIAAASCKFSDAKEELLSELFGKALASACDWNGRQYRQSHPSA